MIRTPQPYEVYRHFKGNYYQIVTVAEHSETGEEMVVYQQLYSPFKTFVRPLEMFMSPVDKKKYPNAKQEMRFALQTSLRNAQNDGLYPEYKKADTSHQKEALQSSLPEQAKSNSQTAGIQENSNKDTVEQEEELQLPPMLVEFLDADSYEEKLEILSRLHREMTDDMINTIAVSLDLEVKEGDIEERYREVMNCLITLEKFECNRLR